MGSRGRCFELGWRDVVAVAVEALFVEPVLPAERGELEFVDVVPRSWRVGPEHALGLEQAVGGLRQGVVERVGDRADRGSRADLVEALCERHRRQLAARIGVRHEPDQASVAA